MNPNTFSPSTHSTGSSHTSVAVDKKEKITVIGAGAFGGWSALHLLRKGYQVTLIDAWGPGNSRSSSGDETRVIRSTYGSNEFYFDLNVRALHLWKENEKQFKKKLFYNTGVLWFCHEEKTPIVDDSIPFSKKHGMEYEYLNQTELQKRFPILNTEGLHHAYFDRDGGYLKARDATQTVTEAFVKEGGEFIMAEVVPGKIKSGQLECISLSNGQQITGGTFLFACGSWLGKLFPEILGNIITCTKQEVYYFGFPSAMAGAYENFPVWIDADGRDFYYGIAGNAHRGFKIGVDKRGEIFDPSHGERIMNPEVFTAAREFITHRFPGLKDAPVLESRVCPYESTPDGNFIFDKHPEADNVVFLGGGSGHGFKHGPALGELVSDVFTGDKIIPNLLLKF